MLADSLDMARWKALVKDDLTNNRHLMETLYLLGDVHLLSLWNWSFFYILIMNLIITDPESFLPFQNQGPPAILSGSFVTCISPTDHRWRATFLTGSCIFSFIICLTNVWMVVEWINFSSLYWLQTETLHKNSTMGACNYILFNFPDCMLIHFMLKCSFFLWRKPAYTPYVYMPTFLYSALSIRYFLDGVWADCEHGLIPGFISRWRCTETWDWVSLSCEGFFQVKPRV